MARGRCSVLVDARARRRAAVEGHAVDVIVARRGRLTPEVGLGLGVLVPLDHEEHATCDHSQRQQLLHGRSPPSGTN